MKEGDDEREGDNSEDEESPEEYLREYFNFSCVLRGHVRDIEDVKEYIVEQYVKKGKLKLVKPTYDRKQIYILTLEEWEEYQSLKRMDVHGRMRQ